MDKNEIIILSSDEESDYANQLEHDLNSPTRIRPDLNNYNEQLKSYFEKNKITIKNVVLKSNKNEIKIVKSPDLSKKKKMKGSKESPEFVDLVESAEKPDDITKGQFEYRNLDSSKRVKQKNSENHSKLDIVEIDEIPNHPSPERNLDVGAQKEERRNILSSNIEVNENNLTDMVVDSILKADTGNKEGEECDNQLSKREADEECNQNLMFFTEFVEYCGSLEKIPNDRARLTKKLMKRYGEADSSYIKSQEFKNLIQKCKDKVIPNNLYLIAKEVTDELSYRKKIEIDRGKSVRLKISEEKSQIGQTSIENNEKAQEVRSKKSKKRTKIINQIITKLDKLGNKIRELERKEVDLSDEEESSYVQLQRYRERFCQIYKKLCKYTSQVVDPDTIYNPKICFTESKYPAINKSIEIWLNKTKRFPDFSDILKLLESQSSSLGLPSSRESIRTIAIEIFQQVGAMLQRKRIYDLWNSLCEFLGSEEDPAKSDPTLDQVLKSNFEARIKKEQEIFQHFSELQEKQLLEPEEVPDEEASRSPVESGSEDDKELEDIENSLHRKLDDAIKKETEDNGKTLGTKDWDEGGNSLGSGFESLNVENSIIKSKESKNNFRNCKSIKWRSENCGKTACLSTNSEDSNTGTENEKEKKSEVVRVENFKPDTKGIYEKIKTEMIQFYVSPTKKTMNVENDDPNPHKKKCTKNLKNEEKKFDVFEFEDEIDNVKEKTNGVFNVHCCQIIADNVFKDVYEKKTGWRKRKVFRDLTNVNRLMELHGKRKKISGLYSPSFFYKSFLSFEKSSWKRRFKVSFKLVGSKNQKCALNQQGKLGKTVKSDSGGDSGEKNIQNNPETGRDDEGDNFVSGQGNGSEEDNNGDKNKKNGRPGEEVNDNQFEEEDEENEDENDDNLGDKTVQNSFEKVEKQTDTNQDCKTPLKIIKRPNKRGKAKQLSRTRSESQLEPESTNKIEDEEPSGRPAILPKKILKEIRKNSGKKVELHSNEEIDKANDKKVFRRKSGGNVKTCEDKTSMSLTGGNQSEKYKFEVKTPNSMLEGEGKFVEELKPVGKEKAKESNKIVRSEATSTKTEQRSQLLVKVKNENQLAVTDNGKEIVSLGLAEEAERNKKAVIIVKKNENKKAETLKRETVANTSGASCKPIHLDLNNSKSQKRNTPSTSDEERVKRFLLHSPSSISIIPPRKLSLSKPPSQAALQALATLRNLKGISTTIVRGKPKNEDEVVVIGGSFKRPISQDSDSAKRRRTDLPVISSVQSIDSTTPKIVTVQGNVSGFENCWQEMPNSGNTECDSSSIRISNVWGSLPNNSNNFMQCEQEDESAVPGCSSQQTSPNSSCSFKKKSTKKSVEYVVLE